jgi:polar amino acid transport system substrate-binding protein
MIKTSLGPRGCYFMGVAVLAATLTLFLTPLAQARPLNFGVMDLVPYGYIDDQGSHVGLFSTMNRAILKEGRFEGESRVIPTKRLTQQILAKTTDCAIFHRTTWSATHLLLVASIGEPLRTLIITYKDNPVTSYEDLLGKQIATLRGSHFGHKFDGDKRLDKLFVEDYYQGAKLLKSGRVDALIGTDLSLYYVLEKAKIPFQDLAEPLVLKTRTMWLHCSQPPTQNFPLEAVRQGVVRLRERGFFADIIKHYLNELNLPETIR